MAFKGSGGEGLVAKRPPLRANDSLVWGLVDFCTEMGTESDLPPPEARVAADRRRPYSAVVRTAERFRVGAVAFAVAPASSVSS